MKQFNEIKEEILKRAHEAKACTEQYKRAYSSASIEELCEVIKDNFYWCTNMGVIEAELIEKYKSIFAENKIYYNVNSAEGYILVYGNATVEANGNATVYAYGNAKVDANGNAKVYANGNTYVVSYYAIECKLNNNAIYRVISTNELHYCSDEIKLVKV